MVSLYSRQNNSTVTILHAGARSLKNVYKIEDLYFD